MIELNIILIASLTSIACAISGVFLVLRRMSLMSDAISHAVLPGIVVAFLLLQDRTSPLLIIGAALSGLLLVYLTELIYKTKLVKEDAAIGLVFPAMFSIGIILVTQFLSSVHFHEHSVLVGDINLSAINLINVFGYRIPKNIPILLGLVLLNIAFISIFFKELKITTFDAGLAAVFGFSPILIHYLFMGLISITAVASFDTAGSILVIALFIAPAASAYLLTDNLKLMFFFAGIIGVIASITGFYFSYWLNSTPSGGIAFMTGVLFLLSYLFSPKNGVVSKMLNRKRLREEFLVKVLLIHIKNHQKSADFVLENSIEKVHLYIKWNKQITQNIINICLKKNYLIQNNGYLLLSENGLNLLQQVK